MELQRDFFNYLNEWKSFKKDECLLIKGARQIGKTFIVEKFGRERYETFVEPIFGSWNLKKCISPLKTLAEVENGAFTNWVKERIATSSNVFRGETII